MLHAVDAMQAFPSRIQRVQGSAYEVGRQLGLAQGPSLAELIDTYIARGPGSQGKVNMQILRSEAMPWMEQLPSRYQEEMHGLADGAGIPLQKVAEWSYVEQVTYFACSSFLWRHNGQVWVARNNDIWSPELWGYAIIRAVDQRIPSIQFGMPAETFTATGINQVGLWLHYHWLPTPEGAIPDAHALPTFIWLSEALETCSDLSQVEMLLEEIPRRESMMLFAVHGPSQQGAIIECQLSAHHVRPLRDKWMAGTNHYAQAPAADVPQPSASSIARLDRLQRLLLQLEGSEPDAHLPASFQAILADSLVEQRGEAYGTVYANIACVSDPQLWFTFGGFPAASQGNWGQLAWPW